MKYINLAIWPFDGIAEAIMTGFYNLCLLLDSFIYALINWVYQIILNLAEIDLFSDKSVISGLVGRVYVVMGVVMLFLLAYSLLRNMVNPDEMLKSKQSPVKLISNVIISVALIALVPYIFQFAMDFQTSLLKYNTIGKLIAGSDGSNSAVDSISDGGFYMSIGVFQAFFHPTADFCQYSVSDYGSNSGCTEVTTTVDGEEMTYSELWEEIRERKNFLMVQNLSSEIVDGKIEYIFFFSAIGGIFVLLVLVSYCIDIAIRTVKLALYQLIAPIPILARLVPGEQGGKVFSNWVKATISTYVEVFIRLAILYFAVLVIVQISKSWTEVFTSAFGNGANPIISFLTMAFLIVGIILFVKQAPEIIKEITGLDGGKYNPLKSMKQGLSLLAGGIAGGSPLAAVRAWEQAGQAKNFLDFSAIGNQYKRKLAKQEAIAQGAKVTDRIGDSFRKAFGFETKLERSNRRIERGRDMGGKVQEFTNDTDGDIVLDILDANGNKVVIKKGQTVKLDDKMINALQNKKDINAQTLSEFDEQIRQIKEGKDLDQKYIDFRGKIKKKALEKINEGHNHIKQDLILADGTNVGNMNYAAMKAYQESRVAAGASADELQMIKEAVMKAEDKMWVEYANWAIEADQGGEIHSWFSQAKQMHDEVGIYDADSGKLFRYDTSDLQSQMNKVVGSYVDKATGATKDLKDNMAIFESKRINIVDVKTGGALTYVDSSGVTQTKSTALGFDKAAKANANGADTQIQHIEIEKTAAGDENKRIDRMNKQLEEAKTTFKSSEEYQRYKASDNANKINDSGKS